MTPVAQPLAIHAAGLPHRRPLHSISNRSQRQKMTALTDVLRPACVRSSSAESLLAISPLIAWRESPVPKELEISAWPVYETLRMSLPTSLALSTTPTTASDYIQHSRLLSPVR